MLGLDRDSTMTKQDGGPPKNQTAAATVRIDSVEARLTAMTPTTVTADGVEGDFVEGQRIHFAFVVPVGEGVKDVPTSGIVTRFDQGRMVIKYFKPQPYFARYLRMAAKHLPFQRD